MGDTAGQWVRSAWEEGTVLTGISCTLKNLKKGFSAKEDPNINIEMSSFQSTGFDPRIITCYCARQLLTVTERSFSAEDDQNVLIEMSSCRSATTHRDIFHVHGIMANITRSSP